MQTTEVARGYRAEAIKLKPVANEKNEVVGLVSDFVFSKDGNNIYVVLSVTDFSGPGSHLRGYSFPQPLTGRSIRPRYSARSKCRSAR
jgi:hypothetical protein